MSEECVEVVEDITFHADGSSHHVWSKDGKIFMEETFKVSPAMFIRTDGVWGIQSAKDLGITTLKRVTYQPYSGETP